MLAGLSHAAEQATLQERLIAEDSATLAADARIQGNAVRGAAVFYARAMACSTCHSVGDRPATLGPDLTKIDSKTSDADLAESVLLPSKKISKGYASVTVETADGRVVTGLPIEESADRLVLRNGAQPDKTIALDKGQIERRQEAQQSIMPAGQVNQLADRQQFLDLTRFLIELRDGGAKRASELPASAGRERAAVARRSVAVAAGRATGRSRGARRLEVSSRSGAWLCRRRHRLVRCRPVERGGRVVWRLRQELAAELFRTLLASGRRTRGEAGRQVSPAELPIARRSRLASVRAAHDQRSECGLAVRRLSDRQVDSPAALSGLDGSAADRSHRGRARRKSPGMAGICQGIQFLGTARRSAASPWRLPQGDDCQCYSAAGTQVAAEATRSTAPLIGYRTGSARWVARGPSDANWQSTKTEQGTTWRLVSAAAVAGTPVVLRLDCWKYVGRDPEIGPAERSSLVSSPPAMNQAFDAPRRPSPPPPVAEVAQSPPPAADRPAVNPRENIDEFPPASGRFLRFVVTRTGGNDAPGIDELEVYGSDPAVNLALRGKASASSVIAGYAIHQIPHLNDGKLGNPNSWISATKGAAAGRRSSSRSRSKCARSFGPATAPAFVRIDWPWPIGSKFPRTARNGRAVGDERGRQAPDRVVGAIRRDASPGYTMESIPLPFSACRPSDIAFGDDGTMYAIAMTEGQIWRTRRPPVGEPDRVHWQRYATGLYHPIGLASVDGRLYVAQKPEITELIDRDGDGIVDQYRTVATGWGLSTGWHEYCFGLGVDPQKNLWFTLNTGFFWTNPGYVNPGRWRGSVMRVYHDTDKLEVMAKGCRVPNGICQGPEGNMFFTDNQGDWIQSCKLAAIVPQRFYGHPETREDALPKDTYPDGRSAVWLPYERSRSTSGPVHDSTRGRVWPLRRSTLRGRCRLRRQCRHHARRAGESERRISGGVCSLRRRPALGLRTDEVWSRRAALHGLAIERPDAHGLFGREAAGDRDRADPTRRRRVRRPIDKAACAADALTAEQFGVKQYHYLYTGNYGSPQADERKIAVQNAELSSDRTAITLTFPVETYPIGMVYEINLGAVEGCRRRAVIAQRSLVHGASDPEIGVPLTYAMTFSPDGEKPIIGGRRQQIWAHAVKVLDAGSGKPIAAISPPWIGRHAVFPRSHAARDRWVAWRSFHLGCRVGAGTSIQAEEDLARFPFPVTAEELAEAHCIVAVEGEGAFAAGSSAVPSLGREARVLGRR